MVGSLGKVGWKRVKFGEVVRLNRETCKDPEGAGPLCQRSCPIDRPLPDRSLIVENSSLGQIEQFTSVQV